MQIKDMDENALRLLCEALYAENKRMLEALEQAIDDFGNGHCVCEATKQMCIDAIKSANA